MNYYNSKEKQEITDTVLEKMLGTSNPFVFNKLGWYPVEYVDPEYDTYSQYLRGAGDYEEVKEGSVILRYTRTRQIVEFTEDELKQQLEDKVKVKADEARAGADAATKPMLEVFSETEKLTFPQQEAEVLAYKEDPNVATPVLDALAASRGITREEQIAKATAKVTQFREMTAFIIGTQQGYEDTIKQIRDNPDQSIPEKLAELDQLVFTYTLPSN